MPTDSIAHKAVVWQKSRNNFQSQNLNSRQGHLDSQLSYVHDTLHVTYDHDFDTNFISQTYCSFSMLKHKLSIKLFMSQISPNHSWIINLNCSLNYIFSVGVSNMQIEFRLNSSPREVRRSNPSGGPFSQYSENFKNSIP